MEPLAARTCVGQAARGHVTFKSLIAWVSWYQTNLQLPFLDTASPGCLLILRSGHCGCKVAEYLLAPHIRAFGRHRDVHSLHCSLATNVQVRLPIQQLQNRQSSGQSSAINSRALALPLTIISTMLPRHVTADIP